PPKFVRRHRLPRTVGSLDFNLTQQSWSSSIDGPNRTIRHNLRKPQPAGVPAIAQQGIDLIVTRLAQTGYLGRLVLHALVIVSPLRRQDGSAQAVFVATVYDMAVDLQLVAPKRGDIGCGALDRRGIARVAVYGEFCSQVLCRQRRRTGRRL